MKKLWNRRPGRRAGLVAVAVVVWLGALLGGALPAWRQSLRQHREIRQVESQLEELDRWSVAGLWLEKSLPARKAAVAPAWSRLFPDQRRCEELFLDLARVADTSGVHNFELHELKTDEMVVTGTDATAAAADSLASAAVTTYRVRAQFESDFAGVAAFLGGLTRLERATTIHQLEVRPLQGAVQTELELDVYVASSSES